MGKTERIRLHGVQHRLRCVVTSLRSTSFATCRNIVHLTEGSNEVLWEGFPQSEYYASNSTVRIFLGGTERVRVLSVMTRSES